MTEDEFLQGALSNGVNARLLPRLRSLGLPSCYLTAGCLFQSIWNERSGRPAEWGIRDYDVFYFDDDLSWDAEDRIIERVADETADLSVTVEVRNQARFHLWYSKRFGRDYPRLLSTRDGIDHYLISCTCVGINVANGAVYAPYGLGELAEGLLRMNPKNPQPDLFSQKALSFQSRWPWLNIIV